MSLTKKRQNRQPKQHPLTRGGKEPVSRELAEIAEYFFKPLLRVLKDPLEEHGRMSEGTKTSTLEDGRSDQECIDIIFGAKYRDIVPAYALKVFTMPGVLHAEGGIRGAKKGTIIDHHVKAGAKLLVRIDERTPDLIDVELMVGNFSSRMFSLTNSEYKSIISKIKETRSCMKRVNRLLPPGADYTG